MQIIYRLHHPTALATLLILVLAICNTEESTTIALGACLGIAQSCERPNDASSNSDSDSDIESDIENVKNYSHLLGCTSNGERREDTTIAESQPCQPTLTQYDRKKCGAENYSGLQSRIVQDVSMVKLRDSCEALCVFSLPEIYRW